MLHDVIILGQLCHISFVIKTSKTIKHLTKQKHFFYIYLPPEGNFDIDAGDGGGGRGTI